MISVEKNQKDALDRLKPAFRACPEDYQVLKNQVTAGNVSLYRITGEHHDLTVAGEVVGDAYFLWGVAGHGVVPAIKELAAIVKRVGLTRVTAETYFPALEKLVKRILSQTTQSGAITELEMRV